MSKELESYSFVSETYLQSEQAIPDWASQDRLKTRVSANPEPLRKSA
jgi:hypothetical protein